MSGSDDFWSLDEFAPKKTVIKPRERDVEAVEIVVDGGERIISSARELTSDGVSGEKIQMRPDTTLTERIITVIPSKPAEKTVPDEEYDSRLRFIGHVKIFRKKDYKYYESFLDYGRKLFSEEGCECPYCSYFSYVPQYSQLSKEQLDCYLNLRRMIREGSAPKAEYSYILLYISELINVDPDTESVPQKLANVWQGYRHVYPKLDALLPEWITDYCLLTRAMPPKGLPSALEEYIFNHAALRELFFSGKDGDVKKLVDSGAYTTYDYRKSKFATPENLPLFEKIIPSVVAAVLRRLGSEGKLRYGTGKLTRDMFTGLLCTPDRKCRVEVDYISLSRSHEVRYIVTDAVKHAENKIRAYLGVKSRLTVYSLPTEERKMIDKLVLEQLGAEKKPKKEEETEYSHLYELPKREFSLEEARKIEESSWKTTELLIEAFEDEETESPVTLSPKITPDHTEPPSAVPEDIPTELPSAAPKDIPTEPIKDSPPVHFDKKITNDEGGDLVTSLADYLDFVRAARDRDIAAQRKFAADRGLLPSTVADRINEVCADILGDILLEEGSSGYEIIEDYAEDFKNV